MRYQLFDPHAPSTKPADLDSTLLPAMVLSPYDEPKQLCLESEVVPDHISTFHTHFREAQDERTVVRDAQPTVSNICAVGEEGKDARKEN